MAEKKNMSLREQLFQDVTPGRKETKTLSNGLVVEVKQPTRGVRNKLLQESCEFDNEGNTKFNPMVFADKCVIHCTYNPETGNRIFRDSDYDQIEKLENADWFDELVSFVQEIIKTNKEDMEKN